MKSEKTFKNSIFFVGKALGKMFPIILGTILLVSLASTLIPESFYSKIFTNNIILDPLAGGLIGSILVGNPIVSYILGGEFLKQGISLVAVTAFIIAWVSVGIVQFPAEAQILGKKFALIRNIVSFILAIISAIIIVVILNLI